MWKTIQYESNYEVSCFGEVRNKTTKHIKSLRYTQSGYSRVTLYPSGKSYTIHRLVANAFLDKIEGKPFVNHKDGIKTNNNLENLEWVTHKENIIHAIEVIKTMLIKDIRGIKNPEAKLNDDIVYKIKFGDLAKLSNKELGKMFGVEDETIRRVKVNDSWKHIVK